MKWLSYMLSLELQSHHLVIAHGSSAEAALRYLESHPLQACILLDASDLYTAGERHGRAFHWSRINANCGNILFLVTGARAVAGVGTSQEAVRSLATFAAHIPNPLDCLRDENDEDEEENGLGLGPALSTRKLLGRVSAELMKICRRLP